MTKRQPAATHPRAAPDQLLSIAIATLASKLNSASIVKKKSPPHLEDAFMSVGSSPSVAEWRACR
jgi:hypothetical protein